MASSDDQHIDVRPIAGALGAEIHGVDLNTLSDAAFAEIEAAWLEHLVIFFRDQSLDDEPLKAFGRCDQDGPDRFPFISKETQPMSFQPMSFQPMPLRRPSR